ncbi:MAG: FAD-dependent oxidoreductase, partial [Candidatus Portnoybacteria bacterium]|nr:FAD-dependent oxidoreductase [Candidatus Portnoybacteria bacterium]
MRHKTPQQPPEERIKNFLEVALGFSESEAQNEASRCLQCKNKPCVKGCPVGIDIPAFIRLIKEGRQKEALEKIKEKNNLPAVCGRVCPQENQCEAVCILNKKKIPINIGALERYAADYALTHKLQPKANSRQGLAAKIAVVGSGPAGLTCAADLAKRGFKVTLFESLHTAGGVLVYGIPEFRLPKKIVQDEVDYIRSLGVELKVDTLIGNTFTLEDLFKSGFRAAFIAVGAGLPQFLGIEGENLP